MAAIIDDNKLLTFALLINTNYNRNINSSSESSDSDSDDEDELIVHSELELLYAILVTNETRGEMFAEKLTGYVERVIPGYSRIIFKEHFR